MPVGTYNLLVTNIEYDSLFQEVIVEDGKITTVKLELVTAERTLNVVTVTAQTQERMTEVKFLQFPLL